MFFFQILFDFTVRFNDIKEDALIKKWNESIKERIVRLKLTSSVNLDTKAYDSIDEHIRLFLILLKFLAPKRIKFDALLQDFLVHDDVIIS